MLSKDVLGRRWRLQRPVLAALFVVLLSAVTSFAEFKVLFVGNSFTIGSGGGGVPGIFDALARAGGQQDPTTVMRAVGGMDYEFHATDATTRSVITSQPWTHVILQNFSTEPTHLVDGTHSVADHLNFGANLYRQIITNNPNTKVILFETWSRAEAHPLITGVSGPGSFASTDQFQEELRTNYLRLARELNAAHPANPPVVVAPVGDAWQNAGGLFPVSDPRFTDLHGTDDYHGNNNGYYLAAAVFYSQIYGASPRGLSTNPIVAGLNLGLTESPAMLEDVAWATVSAANGAQTQTLLVDFGAAGTATSRGPTPDDPSRYWNNVTAEMGAVAGSNLSALVTIENVPTGMGLTIVDRFNGANLNGTTASALFPSDATSDSLFGNTEAFNGLSNIFPKIKLTGLNSTFTYNLRFFASRTAVGDNRETVYTVEGSNSVVTLLNAANNVSSVASANGIAPNGAGEITVSLAPGPGNNSPNHFTYLGVMQVDAIPPQQPVVFTQQPVDQTITSGQPVTFTASVQSTPPYFVQWLSNGVAIPGATQFAYTIPAVAPSMDGSQFAVNVSNLLFSATTTNATLLVVIDVAPPEIQSVTTTDGLKLALTFNEAITPATATNKDNYSVNEGAVNVISAELSGDGRTVILTLAEVIQDTFTVTVSGILDLAGNLIIEASTISGTVPDFYSKFLLFDFGVATTGTDYGVDDPSNRWNNVTAEIGVSVGAQVPNLVTADNTPTEMGLVIVRRFNGANANGTTAVALYPGDATRDSLFGNTELFSGLENIFPSFKLVNLNPALAYHFTFYASRTGATDNRETGYTVSGRNNGFGALNAANNLTNVARVNGIFPSAAGEITVSLAPTANNNNASHFTYLGVMRVDWSLPPRLSALSPDQTFYRFRLNGTAGRSYRVEASEDLVSWANLGNVTLTSSSQIVSRAKATEWRFFRAVALPP